MISVEQIKQLQAKVQSAVDVIHKLRSENSLLASKLSGYEKRIEELEVFIESYKRDQSSIEEGIVAALKKLDSLEESVLSDSNNDSVDQEKEKEEESVDSVVNKKELAEELRENQDDNTENRETGTVENELDIF